MNIIKVLEDEVNKQFPKGDKARGKALVINAIANIEIENAENAIKKKILVDELKWLEDLHNEKNINKELYLSNGNVAGWLKLQIRKKLEELKKEIRSKK